MSHELPVREETRRIIAAMERLCRMLNCRFVIDPERLRIFERAAAIRALASASPGEPNE